MFLPLSEYSRQAPISYFGLGVSETFSGGLGVVAEVGVLAVPPVARTGVLGPPPPPVIHEYFFFPPPKNLAVVLLTLSAEASCF